MGSMQCWRRRQWPAGEPMVQCNSMKKILLRTVLRGTSGSTPSTVTVVQLRLRNTKKTKYYYYSQYCSLILPQTGNCLLTPLTTTSYYVLTTYCTVVQYRITVFVLCAVHHFSSVILEQQPINNFIVRCYISVLLCECLPIS